MHENDFYDEEKAIKRALEESLKQSQEKEMDSSQKFLSEFDFDEEEESDNWDSLEDESLKFLSEFDKDDGYDDDLGTEDSYYSSSDESKVEDSS